MFQSVHTHKYCRFSSLHLFPLHRVYFVHRWAKDTPNARLCDCCLCVLLPTPTPLPSPTVADGVSPLPLINGWYSVCPIADGKRRRFSTRWSCASVCAAVLLLLTGHANHVPVSICIHWSLQLSKQFLHVFTQLRFFFFFFLRAFLGRGRLSSPSAYSIHVCTDARAHTDTHMNEHTRANTHTHARARAHTHARAGRYCCITILCRLVL